MYKTNHKTLKFQSLYHLLHNYSNLLQMLENEVLANRKRLQLEAQAAQTAVAESRVNHSKIVEQLEKEKQKIREDVQRLEERRQRNRSANNTPR